jgi:hypothetical protein
MHTIGYDFGVVFRTWLCEAQGFNFSETKIRHRLAVRGSGYNFNCVKIRLRPT